MESCRPATVADIARVVELAELLHRELAAMRGGSLWVQRNAWPAPLSSAYRALLTRDGALLAVGTIDDVIVGFGAVVVEVLPTGLRLGVVTDLYVEEPAREVGVGEALANALVGHCRVQGCAGVDASALPGQRAAKNFFEGQGFTARALIMHRPLDPGDGEQETGGR